MIERSNYFKEKGLIKYYDLNNYNCCYKATSLYNSIKNREFKDIKKDLKKKKNYYAKLVLKSKNNSLKNKIICLVYLIFPKVLNILSKINFIKKCG